MIRNVSPVGIFSGRSRHIGPGCNKPISIKGEHNAKILGKIFFQHDSCEIRFSGEKLNQMPYVSIIMACHNAEKYVTIAINSVLRQSFDDFEVVFVDDCSSDRSFELVESLSKKDARILVLKTEQQSGAGAARNIAIENAKGEWLAILDADDVFLPDKLEKQIELIKKADSNVVLVGSGCYHINNLGQRIAKHEYPCSSKSLKKNLLSNKKFPPHSSLLYHVSAIRNVGCFNNKFLRAEDYDLWLRLNDVGEFACYNLPLIEYRIHSTNISSHASVQGFNQIVYGTAASVCERLRMEGFLDPSTVNDQELWNTFLEHVASSLRDSNQEEYMEWKSGWRRALQQSHQAFDKLGASYRAIVKSPQFLFLLFNEHVNGNGLTDKCFKSWKEKHPCAV